MSNDLINFDVDRLRRIMHPAEISRAEIPSDLEEFVEQQLRSPWSSHEIGGTKIVMIKRAENMKFAPEIRDLYRSVGWNVELTEFAAYAALAFSPPKKEVEERCSRIDARLKFAAGTDPVKALIKGAVYGAAWITIMIGTVSIVVTWIM